VRPRHESLGRQKVRKCPCRIFEGRTAYASVMLAHLFVVVTEEFHDNRLRNSRFLKKSNGGMPQGVERNVAVPAASPLLLVTGLATMNFDALARLAL
jgi:hypothetical protein